MVKQWEIYFVNLDPTKGSEQQGTRPVLIVSNDAVNQFLPVCTIVPFSSYKKGKKIYPTELLMSPAQTGLDRDSILMFQQIRTIDSSRIKIPMAGIINDEKSKSLIKRCLVEYFDLYDYSELSSD